MEYIAPSKLGAPKRGPARLGSTMAMLQALPVGGHAIVPASWETWSKEWLEANRPGDGIRVHTDGGGIHGAISAIPAGADVGIGVDAYADGHPETRSQVGGVLRGTRFKVIWA